LAQAQCPIHPRQVGMHQHSSHVQADLQCAHEACAVTTTGAEPSHQELEQRERWRAAKAHYGPLPGGGQGLSILGKPVMESWEAPYMAALAAVACGNGGRVLEVGFGLGISAACVDSHPAVEEHVIVEANEEVLGQAALWADGTKRPTTVYGGFWQELVKEFDDGSFSGVLFDAFPLDAEEAAGDGEVGAFFVEAARLLQPRGCFAFYFDVGGSWIECVTAFRRETVPKLLQAGFSRVDEDQVECKPREGCVYFWKDRFLVPCAIR